MSNTSALDGNTSVTNSCWNKVIGSKWIDAALLAGLVALLVIGVLASTGVFNFMGTTNAAYLSYGMYGGAGMLLIAEIVQRFIVFCPKGPSPDAIDEESPAPSNYSSLEVKRAEPLSEEAIQNLVNQAATYVSTHPQSVPLQNYILNVIYTLEFQRDPVAYMEALPRAQDGTEEYRMFKDSARNFFINALNLKNLR